MRRREPILLLRKIQMWAASPSLWNWISIPPPTCVWSVQGNRAEFQMPPVSGDSWVTGSGNMDTGVDCCCRPRKTARGTVLEAIGASEKQWDLLAHLSASHLTWLCRHQIISAQDSTMNEVLIELHSQMVDGGAKWGNLAKDSNLITPLGGEGREKAKKVNIKSQVGVTDPKPLQIKPSNKTNPQTNIWVYSMQGPQDLGRVPSWLPVYPSFSPSLTPSTLGFMNWAFNSLNTPFS